MSASSFRLTVIGAGPAYSDRRGSTGASYLLEDPDGAPPLILDLGHGSFANLASTIEPSALGAVLVTHLHPDHFIDLVPLRHYLRYEFDPPRRVLVFGPATLAERLDALNGDPGFTSAALDVASIDALPARIGPFSVAAHPVTHAASGSFAYRIALDARPGLVYSGDCGRAEDLVPFIHPGDTLLCEASFGPAAVPAGAQHLNAHDAARAARDGRAGRLLITHLQMGFDRAETLAIAQASFGGPTTLVTEGDSFEI